MNRQLTCAGFTLVEMLVGLSLVAMLVSLAVPSLAGMVNAMRVTIATDALFSSLFFARSEAIKRNSRVVLCKSATGNVCGTSGGWEQGWIVFHDANNNAMLDTGEVTLLKEHGVSDPIRLTGNTPVASYVSYNSTGTTGYTSGAFQAGTLTICAESVKPVEAREIKINIVGRPRIVRTTVENCP